MENTNIKKSANLLVDELFEDSEFDQKIVKSFYSKDALSSDIFQKLNNSYKMHESVRDKLLNVANTFIDFLGIKFFIYDVFLTGSLANFNWSEFSDVDLHILIDMDELSGEKNSSMVQQILKEFFKTKKKTWNGTHNIKIKNYDVEISVQDVNETHVSSGVYSILNNKWLVEPHPGKESIDEKTILEKGMEYATLIDDLVKKSKSDVDITNDIDEIKRKLKNFRSSGLEKGGEYSYENLTFKLLRRNGYIEKLMNLKKSVVDKKLSLPQ